MGPCEARGGWLPRVGKTSEKAVPLTTSAGKLRAGDLRGLRPCLICLDSCRLGVSRAFLERLRIIPYDLLITDLKMPGVDGLAVIREARRLKADIPVIIITGFSTEASAIEAVNLGVAGYLTKPFRVPQVLAAAAKALGE